MQKTAEDLRRRMEAGSINLSGVAATLRELARRLEDDHDSEAIVCLLARVVELEAEAMGAAEAFLLSHGKAVA